MITFIFLIGAFIYGGWLLLKWKKLVDSLPPGPPALPIIGNALQISWEDPRNTFVEWHKKYGPMFTLWVGIKPMVFVTDFDLMQELFVKSGDEFVDRPYSFVFNLFGEWGIINSSGERWREQRRFSLHVLRDFGFGRRLMEDKIQSETVNLISSIENRLEGASSKKMNIKPILDVCVSNIISSVILGTTYEENDPTFRQIKESVEKAAYVSGSPQARMLDSFPWLRYIPLFNHFGYDDIIQQAIEFNKIIHSELEKHKKEINAGQESNDFTSVYLKEIERRKEAGEDLGYFDEQQLINIITDTWIAGMETTVTTLSWAILLMMHNQDVQKKVQKEVDDVVGFERYPSMSDRSSMPYTSAVIHEVQRYANILLSNLFRTAKCDTKIRGYNIPKDFTLVPQISVLHFDDAVFDHPREFHPERFLDEAGKLNKLHEKVMPFSLGKRTCLGEGLARMELFLIFTALLQKFSFSFVKGELVPTLKPKVGFAIAPYPYNVCVTQRR